MVPLKLWLRNFMAYRTMERPLDLSGVHVACLSGPNGAGKSALLDAMTWALWGQSRARSDDDLITLGENETEVDLEFAVGEERYRVLRKRSRSVGRRAGQSVLELEACEQGLSLDGEEPLTYRPLTGSTLRETQRRIEELLRLDYTTFVNSALLLQGRADEFTLKTPGERKRVLAEILGLDRYDRLEERARSIARERDVAVGLMKGEIVALEPQVAMRSAYEEELKQTEERRRDLEAEAELKQANAGRLEEANRVRQEKAARLAEAELRIGEAEKELLVATGQQQLLRQRLGEHEAVLAKRAEVESAAREHQLLARTDQSLNQALRSLLALREEQQGIERAIETTRSKLVAEQEALLRETEQLTKLREGESALRTSAANAQQQIKALEARGAAFSVERAALQDLARRVGALQQANEEIVRQGRELRAKVDQLRAGGEAGGRCPLCGTELGAEGHRRVMQEYDQELNRQRRSYRENELECRRLEEERSRREAALLAAEQALDQERNAAQQAWAAAQAGLGELERSLKRLGDVQRRAGELEKALAAGPQAFAPEAHRRLQALLERVAAVGYDEARHRSVQQKLKTLEPEAARLPEIQEAARRLPEEQQNLAMVEQSMVRWRERAADERARADALRVELAALPDVGAMLAEARAAADETAGRLREATVAVGRLEGMVKRCIELEGLLRQKREAASRAEWEKGLYEELAVAFGRRGVQALLIETVLPELEAETNRLLGRMTDNRLTIKLETQRATRAGGLSETLDLTIADELGTRPYELYSGGEAFRVNFALRVSLSKLLARRAGAPLPTLIIDEAFERVDSGGQEKLVEAINMIAEDFERILVLTHFDQMKELFPARIEVTKDEDGSKATLVYA